MKKFLIPITALALMMSSCGSDKVTADALTTDNDATTASAEPAIGAAEVANSATASTAEGVDPATLPVMTFAEEKFNFGTVTQGEKVDHVFKFVNTGKTSLVISNAKGSCGCTVPQYPKEPIAPGAEAKIDVRFDSTNKNGKQHKTVTITHNGEPNKTVLHLEGEVLVPENAGE